MSYRKLEVDEFHDEVYKAKEIFKSALLDGKIDKYVAAIGCLFAHFELCYQNDITPEIVLECLESEYYRYVDRYYKNEIS